MTALENKKYLVKIYGRNGSSLVLNIPHEKIRGLPTFSDRINGGMGECIIDYVVPFDDFGEGVDIDHQFVLDLYAFDSSNPLGRRIYRGTIQEYEPYITGAQQGVLIKALGLGSNLSFDAYMTSSRTVYTVSHAAADPQDIFKAIIDEHRAYVNNPLINYGVGSTQALGTNVNKDFVDRTWFDAAQDTRDLCSTGWWWHVDADGLASLLPKPSTVTHRFIIGKHIQEGNFPKSAKGVKNRIRVTRSGGTITHYTDTTSKNTFESRLEMISESTINNSTTADQRGNKALNDKKDDKVKSTMIINATYDLESIKVGQTCSILNSDGSAAFFGTNVFISGLQYNGDTVQLDLEESVTDLGASLEKFVNA
jgi:hypothetical protein